MTATLLAPSSRLEPVAAQTSTESLFVAQVRPLVAGTPGADRTDAEIVNSGKHVCAEIEAGTTAADYRAMFVRYGVDAVKEHMLVGLSVLTFCPQPAYVAQIP